MRTLPLPAAVAAGLAAWLVSGCATAVPANGPPAVAPNPPAPRATPHPQAPPQPQAPTAPRGPDAAELDAYHPADAAFWDALRLEGVLVVRPPALRTLGARSTVTVLAEVVDVRLSRVLRGTDVLAVVLRPRQVLAGRPRATGLLRVETLSLGPAPTARRLAALRATLPKGLSVWYLRWQGTPTVATKPGAPAIPAPTDPGLYALTHPFAVVAQGRRSVLAPLAERDAPAVGFLAQLGGQRTLSGFVRGFS